MADGRFAPSPTGDLHLGNLRTALLVWLHSRRRGGAVVVRMEDLDRVTSSRDHELAQQRDLTALGLDWDGPVVRQSERFDLYHDALADLERAGQVYPCFCTRREIASAAAAPNAPVTEGYPGTCRELTADRRADLAAAGRPPALRFRSDGASITVDDEILGRIDAPVDDVVIRRNDGVPAYHLAVVVDDDAQGIDVVVRGDDLASVTPSQIALQRALGVSTPAYAHVPLVLGPDGRRLAKRDGAVTLAERIALGDRPTDVLRWLLGTIGVEPSDDGDVTDLLRDALRHHEFDRLPRGPVRLDATTTRTAFGAQVQQATGAAGTAAEIAVAASRADTTSPPPSGSDLA